MNNRIKIKVIKKGEIKMIETPPVPEMESEQKKETKLTSTVSGWINEFQQRRRAETKLANEQFNS